MENLGLLVEARIPDMNVPVCVVKSVWCEFVKR